jgi:predicted dienelactone hydrolase
LPDSWAASLEPGHLPNPTGPFAVGRVTVLWKDQSRIEPLSPNHTARALAVDIWYPADFATGDVAEYLNVTVLERALGADGMRQQFRAAYDAIKTGVQTHAFVGAPFAHALKRSPILVFSPGGGMVKEVYTAQFEELASYGYLVAAISHTYDAIVSVFPDGSYTLYDSKRWPQIPSLEGEANLNQLEWHADDISFVLDALAHSDETGSSPEPFAGHMDFSRVGAFGHSFGGIAAAHACQKDRRFKACLNQDGAVAMRPFLQDARGWGMDQAFMLMERAPRNTPPTEAELEQMKITRQQASDLVARLKANKDRVLRSTGMGSYHVVLQSATTTHTDFSDLSALGARDPAEAEMRAHVLAVVRNYTRAFFDKYLKGTKSGLLDEKMTDRFVEGVQRFAPSKPSDKRRR